MATWRGLIEDEMKRNKDTLADIVDCTLSHDEMDVEFDDELGVSEGKPFTLWTRNYVYFSYVYDGAEDAKSVPRHPYAAPLRHVGGMNQ